MQLKAMFNRKTASSSECVIEVNSRNFEFLRDVASRALRIEEARLNAKADCIMATDYADHTLLVGSMALIIHKVHFDCTSGHNYAPYIVFITKDETAVFGRFKISDLKTIRDMTRPDEECCRCKEKMQEPEILKGDGICTSCVVETI